MVLEIEREIDAKYFTIPFDELVEENPELAIFLTSIKPAKFDLGNTDVLSKVNKCLFKSVLGLNISVPEKYLIPTLGIRYAYCDTIVSYVNSNLPFIEIGTGASAAIALILSKKYQKEVIATELNELSFSAAKKNVVANQLESFVSLLKSEGEIIENLIPEGKYASLLCYPPHYEQDLTRLEKKRGWKGTYDELIGGGEDGMNFTKNLIGEVFNSKKVQFETISVMLNNRNQIEKVLSLLPEKVENKILQLNAGTRKRFILLLYP